MNASLTFCRPQTQVVLSLSGLKVGDHRVLILLTIRYQLHRSLWRISENHVTLLSAPSQWCRSFLHFSAFSK